MKCNHFIAACLLAWAQPFTWAQVPMTEAEVRRVDTHLQKITLKHGEIKNLDMPPMTMVFGVADNKLLSGVGVGDQVRFSAARVNGAFVITALELVSKR